MAKKAEDIKAILQKLLAQNRTSGFTRNDIDKAIIKTKLVADQRSIDNWFNLLWKLEYLQQPNPGQYQLNLSEILQNLEVKVPIEQLTLNRSKDNV